MIAIALFGAGGKMGCRLTDDLKGRPEYDVRYVETGEAGIARLAECGFPPRRPPTWEKGKKPREIAPDHGVTHWAIERIRDGKAWQEVA